MEEAIMKRFFMETIIQYSVYFNPI